MLNILGETDLLKVAAEIIDVKHPGRNRPT